MWHRVVQFSLFLPTLSAFGGPASAPVPTHTFDAIDPKWFASKLYLDTEHDRGILPTDPDPKDKCFLLVNYSVDEHSPSVKEIEFYPSGKIFRETDLHTHSIGFDLKGDSYSRVLREDGTVIYFDHFHDGRCIEGFSIDRKGKKETVTNDGGTLTEPDDHGKDTRRFFGDGGRELIHREGDDIYLNDSWGSWHRKPSGDEELSKVDPISRSAEQWSRSKDGNVTSPRRDHENASQQSLKSEFARLRKEFFAHLEQSAKAGGFSLRELGVEQFATEATTRP